MSFGVLEQLKRDDFYDSIGIAESPVRLRYVLKKLSVVRSIAEALSSGELTEKKIREFVSTILQKFVAGRRIPDGLALAAIAVVLEPRATTFAHEYLNDLAKLQLSELNIPILVAKECLRNKRSLPLNQNREHVYQEGSVPSRFMESMPAIIIEPAKPNASPRRFGIRNFKEAIHA